MTRPVPGGEVSGDAWRLGAWPGSCVLRVWKDRNQPRSRVVASG